MGTGVGRSGSNEWRALSPHRSEGKHSRVRHVPYRGIGRIPPTVRSRQHVAIGLGNPRYGNWLSLHRSRPMAKCPTAALRRRRYRARTDQQPLALLQGSRQAQSWRVRLLQRPRTAPGFQTRTPSPLMVRPQSLSLRISSFATYLSCRRS